MIETIPLVKRRAHGRRLKPGHTTHRRRAISLANRAQRPHPRSLQNPQRQALSASSEQSAGVNQRQERLKSFRLMTPNLVATEQISRCLACGSSNVTLWVESADRQFNGSQKFLYHRCRQCQSLFQSVRPQREYAAQFYPEFYAPHAVPAKPPRLIKTRWRNRLDYLAKRIVSLSGGDPLESLLKEVYRLPHEGARLLDYGCGSAAFLNRARAQGWKTTGVDFSVEAIQGVRENGHEALLVDSPEWQQTASETFDCVRLNHVLEHLYEPLETLRQLRQLTKHGGRLHIAVPNPTGYTARKFRGDWHGLEVPRHVVLFSPLALRRTLKLTGWGEIEIAYQATSRDLTRSRAYRAVSQGRATAQEIKAIVQSPQETDESWFAIALVSHTRWAGRFHAFAKAI